MTLQAIVTKYHGPTERRPARISATSGNGHQRITVNRSELPDWDEQAHRTVAVKLCQKLDWPTRLCAGSLRNGYVFVNQGGAR